MSSAAHIARAKRHGRAFERFPDREIFERDDWQCMCGCEKPCDRTKVAPHPCAPTIGHKIALSCGGDHTRENCETQRWECNARQNNEVDTPVAAKTKRRQLKTGQQARRAKRKAEGKPPLLQGKTKIESRGFDKTRSRKMNGEVKIRG